jgi:hypothetical protein
MEATESRFRLSHCESELELGARGPEPGRAFRDTVSAVMSKVKHLATKAEFDQCLKDAGQVNLEKW